MTNRHPRKLLFCLLIVALAGTGVLAQEATKKIVAEWPGITFSAPTDGVNREGKPQKWIVASDDILSKDFKDFADGDTYVSSWSAEPQTLTPYVGRDRYSTLVSDQVLQRLINMDLDTAEMVPELAKSWVIDQENLTITFKLFKDACFSDGKPVTADDVIFSWDTVMNPKIDSPQLRAAYLEPNIESYKKIDDHTVQFKLKQPYFRALDICGSFVEIIPKHIYKDYAPTVFNEKISTLLVGSGPWKMKKFERGVEIVLERNEKFWGPKPAYEKRTIRFVKNELARLQDYKVGKTDSLGCTSEQWANNKDKQWVKDRGQALTFYPADGGYSYLGYNLRQAKFADKRVRRALTMLVDRWEIVDSLREGLGEVVTGPFYFKAEQYNQDIEMIEHDVKAARALLKEAGWVDTDGDGAIDKDTDGDGKREAFELVFSVPSGSAYGDRLQRYVQAQFGKGGIKVALDKQDWPVFEKRLTERNFDMVSLMWTSNIEGDPYQIWHSSQAENRGSNYIGYRNPEVDKLIEKARMTLDKDKRIKMWHDVHRLINDDQPYTFLFSPPSPLFLDKRFKNVRQHELDIYTNEWYVPGPMQLKR